MTKLIPVTPKTHKDKRWKPRADYEYVRGSALVPIFNVDIISAAGEMPIVFTKRNESFMPYAVLGYEPDNNLFVDADGKWTGSYVPYALKGYPFQVAYNQNKQPILCVLEGNEQITDKEEGIPLFDENGKLTKQTRDKMNFLLTLEQSRTATAKACQALSKYELIQQFPLVLNIQSKKHKLDGLYSVDSKALGQIPDEGLLELRKADALALAYAQLISRQHASKIARLAEERMDSAEDDTVYEFSLDDKLNI
ncbi:SapC family protein [Desulfonatronovibrio magnus]|uniref:SapC family protein n=1 Tax=Desulfonatronovibrio magnus TaxID=698827 RepID=UPI0005EBACA6|nr:SapC family protein [Desulfonatronovibrio magnus]